MCSKEPIWHPISSSIIPLISLFVARLRIAALLFILNDTLEEITSEFLKFFRFFRLLFLRFHYLLNLFFDHSE